jgi:RNA polymerase I-specific transcription initiation factor RRN3
MATTDAARLSAILSAKVQGDGVEYTALLRQLGAAETVHLVQTLQALAQVASCVKIEAHAKLVEVALRQRWREDPELGDATLSFVQEVVSASPGFLRPCMDALVRAFLPEEERQRKMSRGSPAAAALSSPAASAPALPAPWLAPRLHLALQNMLRSCPLGTSQLFVCLKEHFPHRRRDIHCHREYLAQTLKAAVYAPEVLPRLMQMLVERLVELDVELTLQQRELEEGDAEDDEIFEVDVTVTNSEEAEKMRANANKLDAMLVLMFDFIEHTLRPEEVEGAPSTAVAAAAAPPAGAPHQLFDSLLAAFETSLLHTYKCKCTQFLLFYCCSFETAYANRFVQILLTQVRSEQLHTEMRIASAAYLASFVARARFLPLEAVLDAVGQLLHWASEYQQVQLARQAGQPVALDVQLHGVFYSAVQGLLYVLCFKQVQLSSDEAAGFRQTLTPLLQALLDGPLNPLKFCQENVVAEFEKLQLCECAHIIAANERTAVGSHNVGGGANRLDDFFPFDPLLLKHSSERVQPLYKTWEPLHDDPRESNCSSEPSASLGTSFQQMSVTPDDLDSLMRQRLKEQAHSPYVATMTGGFPR